MKIKTAYNININNSNSSLINIIYHLAEIFIQDYTYKYVITNRNSLDSAYFHTIFNEMRG